MARCVFRGGHTRHVPVADVEFCAVPRANQTMAFEFTITEGAAIVRAHVFDAKHLPIQLDDHDKAIFDFEGERRPRL